MRRGFYSNVARQGSNGQAAVFKSNSFDLSRPGIVFTVNTIILLYNYNASKMLTKTAFYETRQMIIVLQVQ